MAQDRLERTRNHIESRVISTPDENAHILPPDGTLIYVAEWRRLMTWGVFGVFACGSGSIAIGGLILGSTAGAGLAIGSLATAVFCVRAAMTGLSLERNGIRLRTMPRTYHLSWDEIDRFELKPRGYPPRFRIHLRDGRVKKARGFSASLPKEEERLQALFRALEVRLETGHDA